MKSSRSQSHLECGSLECVFPWISGRYVLKCLNVRPLPLSLSVLTWLPLSDLPPHRFPDVCRWRALSYRLGNHFPSRRSWRRWPSLCWPDRLTNPPGRWRRLSDCKDQRNWKDWGEIVNCQMRWKMNKFWILCRKNYLRCAKVYHEYIFLTRLLIRGTSFFRQNLEVVSSGTKGLIKKWG